MLYCASADVVGANVSLSVNGNKLTVSFDQPVAHAYQDTAGNLQGKFTVSDDQGQAVAVNSVAFDNGKLVLTLDKAAAYGGGNFSLAYADYASTDTDGLGLIVDRVVVKSLGSGAALTAVNRTSNPNPPGGGGGGDPDPGPTQPSTVTTPGTIAVMIGGMTREAEKQADGTYLIVLTHGTDLTNVAVSIAPPKGSTVSPDLSKGVDFSKGPVKFTITAEDKKTTKEYTLAIITENAPGPDVQSGDIAGAEISRWLLFAKYNADGTIEAEIRIPPAASFDIANLDKLHALLSGLTNLSFAYVDADGNVMPISAREADEPYLRITGTAANKSALESAVLSGFSYWLKGSAAEYRQTFAPALKLGSAQITYSNNPPGTGGGEEEEKGGSGGGCGAGFGALAPVFGAAALRKRGRLG